MNNKAGFTAVEVMIALIIAGVFLITGHQLFMSVSGSQLFSRVRAEASNIAYAHLRHKANTVDFGECPATSHATIIKRETPFENEKLPGLEIFSHISAPYGCSERLLKIEVEVRYMVNGVYNIERQAIFADKV